MKQLAWETLGAANRWIVAIKTVQPTVQKLLELGADVNEVWGRDGRDMPLNEATRSGSRAIISCLLRNGADVNLQPSMGDSTALIISAFCGEFPNFLDLLRAGADVNTCGRVYTALQASALRGYFQITLELLRAGADVNMPAMFGVTALQSAALYGRLDIVRLLVDNNPDQRKLHIDCYKAAGKAHLRDTLSLQIC